jgi:glycerophosphoryl diester phosphodiesterase
MLKQFKVRPEGVHRWLLLSLGIASALGGQLACSQGGEQGRAYETPFTQAKIDHDYEPNGYVAHALGSVDGKAYTNSLEAFELSYAKGYRIYEVDLVQLLDGSVLAAHDNLEERYGLSKAFSATRADEVGKLRGRYTPLFGADLLRLVSSHPDIYMILDTKGKGVDPHVEIAQRLVDVGRKEYPTALERLIPHLINQEHLDRLRAIYPFNDYMLALYRAKMADRDVPGFLRRNGIRAVMMWWDQRYTSELVEAVNAAGAVAFVHSLTRRQRAELVGFRSQGIGAYTNGLYLHPKTAEPVWGKEVLPNGGYDGGGLSTVRMAARRKALEARRRQRAQARAEGQELKQEQEQPANEFP